MKKLLLIALLLVIVSIRLVNAQIKITDDYSLIRPQVECYDIYDEFSGDFTDNPWQDSESLIWLYDDRITVETSGRDIVLTFVNNGFNNSEPDNESTYYLFKNDQGDNIDVFFDTTNDELTGDPKYLHIYIIKDNEYRKSYEINRF